MSTDYCENRFPCLLIKVQSEIDYINDFLAGKLYMKESGYFRKLEDGYRGDPFDGQSPIHSSKVDFYIKNPVDGTKLRFGIHGIPVKDFTVGFDGDDKIPIFCLLFVDEESAYLDDNVICIKDEYIDEMKKFGKYAGIVLYDEFMFRLRQYINNDYKITLIKQKVEYVDLFSEYSFAKELKQNKIDPYARFFKKDKSYQNQNELRIVAASEDKLIGENDDHFIIDLGRFETGQMMELY